MTQRRVIINTDPGIGDALALILAFASPGNVCGGDHNRGWQRRSRAGGPKRLRDP